LEGKGIFLKGILNKPREFYDGFQTIFSGGLEDEINFIDTNCLSKYKEVAKRFATD